MSEVEVDVLGGGGCGGGGVEPEVLGGADDGFAVGRCG